MNYINPSIYLKNTSDGRGKGVFARERIAKGEIITRITEGQILTNEEYVKLPERYQGYCCDISADKVFCPADFENPTLDWFINHSCDPSVGSGGDIHTLVAMRDIEAGEELTLDYAMVDEDPNPRWRMACACGSPHCRGLVKGDDWKLPELQEKYRGYFQKNIQEKIDALKRGQ